MGKPTGVTSVDGAKVDRTVELLFPKPATNLESAQTFSDYADAPNIVLLGEPGAGKTHLFRNAAEAAGGKFLTVRNFLNGPKAESASPLFIDALDEKRARRGDDDAVDAMVRKLFENRPAKIRISCRERDWLGESDLAAFLPYFDQAGGAVVLRLLQLSLPEKKAIVASEGIEDPVGFLAIAAERGLEEFLDNPQNLKMLAAVVNRGDWPRTRLELFETATRLLLEEHNRERARFGGGNYSAEELRDAAGAICAVRLVSGAEGVSLADYEGEPDYPSYRGIDLVHIDKVRAVLGRRVFTNAGPSDCVDYTHRTTAEYLAAAWLAKRMRDGFPVGRLRALIGVDGRPALELRGLHAWLPIFLQEHANVFVESDPYGVVTYGDAASLTSGSRQLLIAALARLSKTEPGFRGSNPTSVRLGALAGPDMVEAFRSVLRSPDSDATLRSTILDALREGISLPELEDDLLSVMVESAATYVERHGAFLVLLKLGSSGRDGIARAYRERMGWDANGVRLRVQILKALYVNYFTSEDVLDLLRTTSEHNADLATGTLWVLSDTVPLRDVPAVLDRLTIATPKRHRTGRGSTHEIAYVAENLLLRALRETANLSAERVLKWLRRRASLWAFRGHGEVEAIKEAIQSKQGLAKRMAEAAASLLPTDETVWRFVQELRQATLGLLDEDEFVERVSARVFKAHPGSEEQTHLYETAFALTFRGSVHAVAICERLYALADEVPTLAVVRDRMTFVEIPEWKIESGLELERERIETASELVKLRADFAREAASVRSGIHVGWLAWAADVYFNNFSDTDRGMTPSGRLISLLGEELAAVALEGFEAVTRRTDLPALDVVAQQTAEGSIPTWWLAIVAGLDRLWEKEGSLDLCNPELLQVALAVEIPHPGFEYVDNVGKQMEHGWKTAVLETSPGLAADVCFSLADTALKHGTEHVEGLYELINEPAFAAVRQEAVVELLRRYPNARSQRLKELLDSACAFGARQDLLELAREVARESIQVDESNRDKWLVAGYLVSPDEFRHHVTARSETTEEIAWLLRDIVMPRRRSPREDITVKEAEFLAGIGARCFPNTYSPLSWSGDRNPWDGAEFVRALIEKISADPSETATAALTRLESDSRLATYCDQIRRALANQRARWRENEYAQPTWKQAIAALAGGPPANVSDLHALLTVSLRDVGNLVARANNDAFKRFWNEDQYGRPTNPKPEESCRNALLDFLKPSISRLGVAVEPEGQMAAKKRADIVAMFGGNKVPVELKRDYHADVWSAAETQLERLYAHDVDASGFGVYCVLWFGSKRPAPIPKRPGILGTLSTAAEMETALLEQVPTHRQPRTSVVVIDASGERQ